MENIRRRLGAFGLAVLIAGAIALTPASAYAKRGNNGGGNDLGAFCSALASTIATVEGYPDSFIRTYLLNSLNATFNTYCRQ